MLQVLKAVGPTRAKALPEDLVRHTKSHSVGFQRIAGKNSGSAGGGALLSALIASELPAP